MIVADRKNVPEIRDMIKDHRQVLVRRVRHLRDRLPGRRRARGGHPGLRGPHGAQAGPAAATWWSTNAPSSGSARTRSSTRLAPRVAQYDAICLVRLRRRRAGPGRAFSQDARLSGTEHPVHRHPGIAGRLDREVQRLRQLPAGPVRGHLPDYPLCQAAVQRPLRRFAGRQVRSERRTGLRLAVDLRSRQVARIAAVSGIDRPAAGLVDRPGRRPAKVVREDQCIAGLGPKA